MNKIYAFLVLLCLATAASAQSNFTTKWKFDAAATSISFNALTSGSVSYTWAASPSGNSGSGSFTQAAAGAVTLSALTITAGDVVTLSMEPQNLRRFYIRNGLTDGPDKDKLVDVSQWGTVPWTSMEQAFDGCSMLNITAADIPDLSHVTSMFRTFADCAKRNGPANMGSWNTEHVTVMNGMFSGATAFNQDIGNWNTEKVTSMTGMFSNATAFNQDIGGWQTGEVLSMTNMFSGALAFNQDIGGWDTRKVTGMLRMFQSAFAFNQGIGGWDTGNVTNMDFMFGSAFAFNQDIGGWKLNSSVNMTNMLYNTGLDCSNYSQTLIGWQSNNPGVTGRTLGADGRVYTPSADAARAALVTNGWTISGDSRAGSPVLVAAGQVKNGVQACTIPYADPLSTGKKLIDIQPNGNTFDDSQTTVTVSNQFAASVPAGVTKQNAGFYQANSGSSTLRVSRRLHSIVAPAGTYSVNGGVIVRVYYDPAELTAITDNTTKPAGSGNISYSGWFKSSRHNALDVANDISATALAHADPLTPSSTGTEDGISYAEFKLQTFSTIGYYASSSPTALPVTLLSFSGKKTAEGANTLTWVTSDEKNFDSFQLQRSADARTFENIGSILATGQKASPLNSYQFVDHSAAALAYYRLKMIDTDGTFAYSRIISIGGQSGENEEKPVISSIYPNPALATAFVDIYLPESGSWAISVCNAAGKTLYTETKVLQKGMNKVPVNTPAMGLHLIRLQNGKTSQVRKLLRE